MGNTSNTHCMVDDLATSGDEAAASSADDVEAFEEGADSYILREDGGLLLREDGSRFVREA